MIKLLVVSALLLSAISIGVLVGNNIEDKEIKENINNIEHKVLEKVPLYYNMSESGIIYTKNKLGEFVEVKING